MKSKIWIFCGLCLLVLAGCNAKREEIVKLLSANATGKIEVNDKEFTLDFFLSTTSNFNYESVITLDTLSINKQDLFLSTTHKNLMTITYQKGNVIVYVNGEKRKELNESLKNPTISLNPINTYESFRVTNVVKDETRIQEEYLLEKPNILLDDIHFDSLDDVQQDFWLIPSIDDYSINWESTNPEGIKIDYRYARVNQNSKDVSGKLIASIQSENQTYQKEFPFTVKGDSVQTRIDRDAKELQQTMSYIVSSGSILPKIGRNGSNIQWESLTEGIKIEKNQIVKTSSQEKLSATVQATLQFEEQTLNISFDVLVLDVYEGYILSYFNGELEHETMKLAYSYDGLHWQDIHQGQTIFSTALGSGRIRDPFISRDKDGNFVVLATQGFDYPSIYISHSRDLTSFYDTRLVEIVQKDEELNLTGERAWAPEFRYVPSLDEYKIYFSDPMGTNGGSIFAVNTKDFKIFTYPYKFLDTGYPIIDGTIMEKDEQLWMFYKDERAGALTIYFANGTMEEGFHQVYDRRFISLVRGIEGPFIVNQFKTQTQYLYVDEYSSKKFLVAKIVQLGETSEFEWLDESEYQLPNQEVRHGSVIEVTKKELDKILAYYQ